MLIDKIYHLYDIWAASNPLWTKSRAFPDDSAYFAKKSSSVGSTKDKVVSV